MKMINYVLAAALALLGLSCSQDNNHSRKPSSNNSNKTATLWNQVDNKNEAAALRRLESVTWDSVKHQLTWDVSKGAKQGDSYQPQSKDSYAINMDSATMTVNGETRRFSEDEASNVRTLMDFISRYALESTVWWENGEGDPVNGNAPPVQPQRQNPHKAPQQPTREGAGKAIQILHKMESIR